MMLTLRTAPSQLPADWDVPEFACRAFAQRRTRHCVILPARGEGTPFLRHVSAMAAVRLGVDAIVIDGGGNDGSCDPDRLRQLDVRALLTGGGSLLRIGLAYGLSEGYAGCIVMERDGRDAFAAIRAFAAALDQHYDLVQASRRSAAGHRYSHSGTGFRAYGARLLGDPRVRPFRALFDDDKLYAYLAVRAPRLGYRVLELPVAPGNDGTSGGRLRAIGRAWRAMAMIGAYNPRR